MIIPNWHAPSNVHAISTCRAGGFSLPPFDSNNLGQHVGDNEIAVLKNRAQLNQHLPQSPLWCDQRHTTVVHHLNQATAIDSHPIADAVITSIPNKVCLIMTADCLPILLCDKSGHQVAAVHGGWRGIANGIVENTVAQFIIPPHKLMAWLGPAIGPKYFEVGSDVLEAFCQNNASDEKFFLSNNGKYLADIYQLARARLIRLGITDISVGDYCTYTQQELFFSYRRSGITGRMASLIWLS